MKKIFFWKDLSGRGFSNQWTLAQLKKAMAGERSDDGQAASTWAKEAEVGDEWSNAANQITCIEYRTKFKKP